MELERLGIRNASFPFDWLISGDLSRVLAIMENHFQGFTDSENLYQEFNISPAYYYNKACDVHFYHDFSKFKSFDRQYEEFKEKYRRRIDRFYRTIQKPTLFIRYCAGSKELEYVFENQQHILSFLKTFHTENEILYLSDADERHAIDNIYYITKDEKGVVPRKFLDEQPELKRYLWNHSTLKEKIKSNQKRYRKNRARKHVGRVIRKAKSWMHVKVYHHYQQYEELLTEHDEQCDGLQQH